MHSILSLISRTHFRSTATDRKKQVSMPTGSVCCLETKHSRRRKRVSNRQRTDRPMPVVHCKSYVATIIFNTSKAATQARWVNCCLSEIVIFDANFIARRVTWTDVECQATQLCLVLSDIQCHCQQQDTTQCTTHQTPPVYSTVITAAVDLL